MEVLSKMLSEIERKRSKLLSKRETCCEVFVFSCYESLEETQAWPVRQTARRDNRSLSDILDPPAEFDFRVQPPRGMYGGCNITKQTKKDFDGPGLDCMSKPKIGEEDEVFDSDYWIHDPLEQWDTKYRIKHSQSASYRSFIGRPEKRDLWNTHQRRRDIEFYAFIT
ncbi:hypothetical protein MKZ38_001927 [Zalerion maritima]|uniref:Uncharacterized protein n=1 Tax=Zalerion maritima TaxID=339359 RepID=A0AAD5RR54_9PEZI|nr:hypothetical protein MKZ38_001927 [Zalerion maritima]